MGWKFFTTSGSEKQAVSVSPTNLDDLGDVILSAPAAGQTVVFNGTNYTNVPRVVECTTATVPAASSYTDGQLLFVSDWGVTGVYLENVSGSSWAMRTRPRIGSDYGSGHRENLPWAGIPYVGLDPSSLQLSIGTGLSVDYNPGYVMIDGCALPVSGGTKGSLTASTTNYIFVQATYTGAVVTGYSVVSNTTGTAPADSVYLGRAVTGVGTVTSVANSYRGVIVPGTVIAEASTSSAVTQQSSGSFTPSPALLSMSAEFDPNINYRVEFDFGSLGVSAGTLTGTYIDLIRDYSPGVVARRDQSIWSATGQYRAEFRYVHSGALSGSHSFSLHGTQAAAVTTDFRINNSSGFCRIRLLAAGAN